MNSWAPWRRLLGRLYLFPLLLASPGCLGFLHPVEPIHPVTESLCQKVPMPCRSHVYIFCVNGLDPLNYGNLTGLRDYLHDLGFTKIYNGQLYHGGYFEKEIRRVNQEDPEARFVLIGFSLGANVALSMAQSVKADGIPIALMVYLGGDMLSNKPENRPENVGHLVNILASGFIWNGDTFDNADNMQVPDVWHFGSPTHPQTLEVLSRELAQVALTVPVIELAPNPRKEEPEPTPRSLRPAKGPRDKWDFLKPVKHLAEEPSHVVAR